MICNFGCGNSANFLFKSGNWCCSKYTSSCPGMKKKNNNFSNLDIDTIDWSLVQVEYNRGSSQKLLCQQFHLPPSIIQKAAKQGKLKTRTRSDAAHVAKKSGRQKLTDEGRERLRQNAKQSILKRYESGWMPKAGRCKKYKHISPVAGEVYLDGTWELAVAEWLDNNGYVWTRNTKKFQYVNLKGSMSFYVPDFWIEELQSYVEVKGYETDLDRCKWSQFTENLIVWKRKELTEMQILL